MKVIATRPTYLYQLAYTYYEFIKGRVSELKVLNTWLKAEEAGRSRRALDAICNTVDKITERRENG